MKILSTRRPSYLACRHEFALSATKETHYLYPPSIPNLLRWTKSGGRGFWQALEYLRGLGSSGLRSRVSQLGLLVSAVDLVWWAQQHRVEHVHGHSCANSAHVLALARRLGGPTYSLTLHGDLDVYGGDHRSKMREATFVCAVGSHLRRQIRQQVGLADDRVIVTCMGVDTEQLARLGQDRSSRSGQLHVITIARLHPAKGHLHALAAVHQAQRLGLDIHYTIAGDGPYRETLAAKVDELGLQNRVTLSGTLSETEVDQLLSKADAFLLPSTGLGEAWPVSVMEAMGAGLPVISSVIGATPEMITSGDDGLLVAQGDESAILREMMHLGYDVEFRQRLGTAARRTACRRFDVRLTAKVLPEAIRAFLQP